MDFPAPNEAQFTFHYTTAGQSGDVVNVLGAIVDGALFDQADNDAVAVAWRGVVSAGCSSDVGFVRLTTLVGIGGGIVAEFETANGTFGGQSPNSMPSNNAVLVHKGTGFAGRRNQGRIYLPGVSEPDVDDAGALSNVYRTGIDTALATFATTVNAMAHVTGLAILHRAIIKPAVEEYTLAAEAATLISQLSTEVKIATQRKRLRD